MFKCNMTHFKLILMKLYYWVNRIIRRCTEKTMKMEDALQNDALRRLSKQLITIGRYSTLRYQISFSSPLMCIPQTTEQCLKHNLHVTGLQYIKKPTRKTDWQVPILNLSDLWQFLEKDSLKQIKISIYFGSQTHQNNVLREVLLLSDARKTQLDKTLPTGAWWFIFSWIAGVMQAMQIKSNLKTQWY